MINGKPLVMIGVPSAGIWKAPMGHNAVMLTAMSVHQGILVDCLSADSCYVEQNRNNIVGLTLGYHVPIDAILWIDTDMKFPPDALIKLWNRKQDIAGCDYRARNDPFDPKGAYLDGKDHRLDHGMHKMSRLPGGFILVKLDVYRKMARPWYKAPVEEGDARDDYHFCDKAREAGFDVWCDMDLTPQVMHRGEYDVPWLIGEHELARRAAA